MNQDQHHLLRAARLSGRDEHDPAVLAARAAAALQPDLVAQLEQEHQRDLAMRAALHEAVPPAGLEAALLTAMRAARGHVDPPASLQQSVLTAMQQPPVSDQISAPRFSRRHWMGCSAAAAAALAAGSVWWWRSVAFSMHRLSRELATISAYGVQLSLMSMDPAAINGWLGYYKAPRSGLLPDKLQALPRKGCHLYQIDGHPVSLECFLLPGMRELHLFCTPAAGLLDPPPEGGNPDIHAVDGRTLATWTRSGQTILLFSEESPGTMQSLLS